MNLTVFSILKFIILFRLLIFFILERIKPHEGNALPWLGCARCKKIRDDLAAKYLEAGINGVHWLPNQRTKSNKDERLHDELNHVDIEPLNDTLVQMKAQLRELEPTRRQWITYQE